MARPSLADSLMASLSKGAHVDTAEKIKRGLPPISDEPAVAPVTVSVPDVTVKAVDVQEVMIGSAPAVVYAPSPKPKATAKQKAAAKPKVQAKPEAAHTGTHSGTVIESNTGTHSGMDTNKGTIIQTGMDTSTLSGMDTGIEAGPDRHGYRSEPMDTGIDTNKGAGIDAGIHIGLHTDTHSDIGTGIDTGLDTSSHSGIDIGTLDGTHIYDHIHPDAFFPFTPGQGKVLLYLIEAGGKSNRNVMAARTGVPLSSLAKTLRLLEKVGYIKRAEQKVYDHRERGFYYSTDRQMCSEFYERVTGTQIATQSGSHIGMHAGIHTGIGVGIVKRTHIGTVPGTQSGIHAGTQAPFSSRVFEEKELTTSKTGLLNDPELRFWSGEGVTEKQVANWMAEFELSEEEIVLSLRYARFDILERGDVQNSANWFYKLLTRNGFYPRPANYKSLVEIKAEALKQQQERDREARAELEANSLEVEFVKFLADPDAPLYQELLEQVSGFAKDQLKDGDRHAVEIELKELFKNVR
jgi:hypothetical protein